MAAAAEAAPRANPALTGEGDESDDLLIRHSKTFALVFGLLALSLLGASLIAGISKGLPTVAFEWVFGLKLFRAVVAFALVTGISMFFARAWGGSWPRNLSTTGIDYGAVVEGSREINSGTADVLQTTREMIRLELELERKRHQGG